MLQKTASKRAVQKTADATGDFIENKTSDLLTSAVKSKNSLQMIFFMIPFQ